METIDETLEEHLEAITKAIHVLKTVPKAILNTHAYNALDLEPQGEILWAIDQLGKAATTADAAFFGTINDLL